MKKYLYDIFALMAATWLLTACSSDDSQSQQDDRVDFRMEIHGITRSGDDAEDDETVGYDDIHVFLKDQEGNESVGMFKYYHEDATAETAAVDYWLAHELKVKPGKRKFSLYGYMPDVTGLTGSMDYTDQKLTISGIEPMTKRDICVVTGVMRSEDVNAMPYRSLYEFDYVNTDYNDRTILILRLEHLLGRLAFEFKIGSKYSQLRKIVVTSLSIETETKSSISATVNLPKLKDDVITVDYTATGEVKTWKSVLLTTTDDPVTLSTEPTVVGERINVAVGGGLSDQYVLVSTYDVYDLQGHKLSSRTARNKLTDVMPVKSQVKEVVLTIEPTYLYQLADDDLNNPEVKINE